MLIKVTNIYTAIVDAEILKEYYEIQNIKEMTEEELALYFKNFTNYDLYEHSKFYKKDCKIEKL